MRLVHSTISGLVTAEREIATARARETAAKRMAHLAPFGVRVIEAAALGTAPPAPQLGDERLRPLALRVMAIQLWHAANQSVLK